jgi:oligopeptide/dipeptide ABC transporter ATP-binding protein
MDNILISTRRLTRQYPAAGSIFRGRLEKRRAVDDVSLDIMRGEVLGVVGESGCGKSTLGRMIVRLLPATSGNIIYNGEDITNSAVTKALRRRMQIVFQDPYGSLNPWMTIYKLVAEPMEIHGLCPKSERIERVTSLLEKTGLSQIALNRYPHQLSGGQRQRLSIARALSVSPEFLLCDEPVSALDVSVQSQILNLLIDLQRDMGLTYLFISHNLAVIRNIADRVAVMYLGRIVEISPADDFFASPAHPYSQALLDAAPIPETGRQGRRKTVTVSGEATFTDAQSRGCEYYPRCPRRADICAQKKPELKDLGGGRRAACHLGHRFI